MFNMLSMNADTPIPFVDIHADVNWLTREVNSVTFIHGKPPLGVFLFR